MIIDLAQCNAQQLRYLKNTFPSILYQGRLTTPTAFHIKKAKHHHQWHITACGPIFYRLLLNIPIARLIN